MNEAMTIRALRLAIEHETDPEAKQDLIDELELLEYQAEEKGEARMREAGGP